MQCPNLWIMSIIFLEPVRLYSPDANKNCLCCITFPLITAKTMSWVIDEINRACFSVILWSSYFNNGSRKVHRDLGGVRESSYSFSEVGGHFISCSLSYLFMIPSFNDYAVALIWLSSSTKNVPVAQSVLTATSAVNGRKEILSLK